ncbi:MAG: winged helix-turn-helix domain-containing protein [Ktedonobacteraceae bacterium]
MSLHLSQEEARRFLANYHFVYTDIAGVFEQLSTVQYDPLNPVGRNPDLVFQARVPGYRVDDWQYVTYTERVLYDSWDKQACLVPMSDWSKRTLMRERYEPYHDREILKSHAVEATAILAALDARGPLSSLELEDRASYGERGSWYGSTVAKRILRALWASGQLVTHHRKNGRHYYDRPERVIPSQYYNEPPLLDEDDYHRWIMTQRVKAMGLLRPMAEQCIWSACGDATTRKRALAHLAEDGTITPLHIEGKTWTYYILTAMLPFLNAEPLKPRMIFLGPLDSLMWDRKAIQHIFNFDYMWEVYKPASQRRWGYYVLPVFYKDRFVARFDSRLEKGIWNITNWWWEPDVVVDDEMLDALRIAKEAFLSYLRARDMVVLTTFSNPIER